MAIRNLKHRFVFTILFCAVLASQFSFVSAVATCGGSHSWYWGNDRDNETVPQLSANLVFSPEATVRPPQGGIATYAVKAGTNLSIANINSVVLNCVNGASTTDIIPVRLVEIRGDQNIIVKSNATTGAYVVYRTDGQCNAVSGSSTEFNAYKFILPGIYRFRVEFSQYINGKEPWATYREFYVLVGPPKLQILPPDANFFGMKKSVYGQENEATKTVSWYVKNDSGLKAKITGIDAINCPSAKSPNSDIYGCGFPNFRGELNIDANSTVKIDETFKVALPGKSPQKERLQINLLYTDEFGSDTQDTATGYPPVDQNITYGVVQQAITPYKKNFTFRPEKNKRYWLQVCTDSPKLELYNIPLFQALVRDSDGQQVGYATKPDGQKVEGDFRVAGFYAIKNCSNNDNLRPLNQEGGLLEFVSGNKDGDYIVEVSGIVGIDPLGTEDYYTSDFIKIGTSFDNASQTIPDENLVAEEQGGNIWRLGPQNLQTAPGVANQKGSVTVFDGTKQLGSFALPNLIPDSSNATIFALSNVSILNSKTLTTTSSGFGYLLEFSDGNTTVSVRKDYANGNAVVSARTNYLVKSPNPNYPKTDLNVFWVDLEKYMFDVKGGAVGLCRNLQGDAIGLTGPDVRPKVKYDWRADRLSESECDYNATNPNSYTVCDSMQFSIGLLKKLKSIDELARAGNLDAAAQKLRFDAFLMRDSFSPDFRSDFNAYYRSGFYSEEDSALAYSDMLGKYFSDPELFRFNLTKNGAQIPEDAVHEPGLYSVNILIGDTSLRLFDAQNNPTTELVIYISFKAPVPSNLLYYLPIDGKLGTPVEGGGNIDRTGYGVGFKGDRVPWALLPCGQTVRQGCSVYTDPISESSNPIATINVLSKESIIEATKTSASQVFYINKLDKTPEEYEIVFTNSYPVPTIIEASNNGGVTNASYELLQNGPFTAGAYLTRLVEIGYKPNASGARMACTDAGSNSLKLPAPAPPDGKDAQKGGNNSWCVLNGQLNNENVYGFNRASAVDANVYLETVFYPPTDGLSYSIKNACATQGTLYVADINTVGNRLVAVKGFFKVLAGREQKPFTKPGSAVTIANALQSIDTNGTCLAASGTEGNPKSVGVWWNEAKFLSELRAKVATGSGIPDIKTCFPQ